MPQDQQRPPARLSPSRRLLDLLGIQTLDDDLATQWPELAQSWAGREIEMPDEAARVNQVREMNWLDRMRNPDAYAVTSPTNVISMNRDLIGRENQNLGDVLTHELAHVGQQNRGMVDTFRRRMTDPTSLENEAVNAEAMRPVRRKDIRLRGPRSSDLRTTRPQPVQTVPPSLMQRLESLFLRQRPMEPPANITGPRGEYAIQIREAT